jgi:hypothetical protein
MREAFFVCTWSRFRDIKVTLDFVNGAVPFFISNVVDMTETNSVTLYCTMQFKIKRKLLRLLLFLSSLIAICY